MKRSRLSYIVIASLAALTALVPQAALAAASGQASGDGAIGFLFAGTVVVWVGFFAYAFFIAGKNRDLQRELEDLQGSSGGRGIS